ncbi:hypothetical protein X798_05355 [Onchocerca flexuosa]|uniref:Uncharacterized protein n=2 Tax=Onchocerca flexuosa TaxID=387005 RepID=A0A183H637_9BILA|nr:hypothetical protein X798_05355 [Onchocerca flexuosa]VDO34766.1 unnamed protein product [Onchocerca flexuosa]
MKRQLASNRHTRSDRALSVGCQYRSHYTAISELTPSKPLFQDCSSIPLKKLRIIFGSIPILHSPH